MTFLAAVAPANQYEADGIIGALDCDGPGVVYLFALPVLLLYGAGAAMSGRSWWRHRRAVSLAAALVCAAIFVAVLHNFAVAWAVDDRQAAECNAFKP